MKNIIKYSLSAAALVTSVWILSSCTDWTDPESLGIHIPSLEDQNPGLYADYLKDLKNYKSSDHTLMFVSFENKKEAPSKQAEQLTALPDSIDYISLKNPDELHPWIQEEMGAVREKKGTRTIYSINYSTFESDWNAILKAEGAENYTEEQAREYITKRTEVMLALCNKYNYDGVTVTYTGRSMVSLKEEALKQYVERQKMFFDIISAWYEKNTDRILLFEGNIPFLAPENMTILTKCRYIILMTASSTSNGDMDVAGNWAVNSAGNLLDDASFIVSVETVQSDDAEGIHGYFTTVDENGNKLRAIKATAKWLGRPANGFARSGMYITNAQYDYYDADFVYRNIREAIGIMNPSPKK